MYGDSTHDYIRRMVEDEVERPLVGRVTQVYEHTDGADSSNFEVDVTTRGGLSSADDRPFAEHTYHRVAVMQPSNGSLYVPTRDEYVVMLFVEGGKPLVIGSVYTNNDRAPLGSAGLIRHTRGGLYLEIGPDGEFARLAKKTDDDADPEATVELDDSGDDVTINIDASGSVRIGDSDGTFAAVAREGDPVSVDPDTGSGEIASGSDNVESS